MPRISPLKASVFIFLSFSFYEEDQEGAIAPISHSGSEVRGSESRDSPSMRTLRRVRLIFARTSGRGTSIYCPSRAKDADNFLVQVHPTNATSRPRITRIQTRRPTSVWRDSASLPHRAYLYSGRLLHTERRCSSQLITLSPLTTMTPRFMLSFNVSALSPSTSSCLSWLASFGSVSATVHVATRITALRHCKQCIQVFPLFFSHPEKTSYYFVIGLLPAEIPLQCDQRNFENRMK